MYQVCYSVTAVNPDMPDDMLIALNEAQVEGLALVDQVILQYYNIPPLYYIAPRYYTAGREQWKDIAGVLRDRNGDCKDFTAWRLAELRHWGWKAKAESIVHRVGKGQLLFHTYIRHANGLVEDPARILGMP